MRGIINISLFFVLLMTACSTPKNNNTPVDTNNRMEFTVTNIQNEKDGQTILLKDDNGGEFTTIISPANGNFIELNPGDEISLAAAEIKESAPTQIISKDIKVLSKKPSSASGYEKTEEETYWIHAQKAEARGMNGSPIKCLQYQTGASLDKNGKWEVLCDQIANFKFQEGSFYQIKVLKKWLRNHESLMDRSPYNLELMTIISKEKDPAYSNPIETIISTDKSTYKAGEPIMLSFEIKNTGDKPFAFLPWQTPLEKKLTSDCIQIMHKGATVSYSGIMVKRAAPSEKDYQTLQPGESATATINLNNDYKLAEKGSYNIQFKKTRQGLPASNELKIDME